MVREAVATIARLVHGVTRVLELLAQQVAKARMIVDEEDAVWFHDRTRTRVDIREWRYADEPAVNDAGVTRTRKRSMGDRCTLVRPGEEAARLTVFQHASIQLRVPKARAGVRIVSRTREIPLFARLRIAMLPRIPTHARRQ
jgi:hypothetical protein